MSARAAKDVCDEGRGVGPGGRGVYLDFADAIKRIGEAGVRERYGNLFDILMERSRAKKRVSRRADAYLSRPVHYTMGGLWVDYDLMSTVPGLFVLGEANFSDHGANRLGASALMQGLADGYFVAPYTLGNYFATAKQPKPKRADQPEFKQAAADMQELTKKLLAINGKRTVNSFHKELGTMMWEKCGMARNEKGLKELLAQIPALREEFWKNVKVAGQNGELNQNLEHAGRVADFLEFAELLAQDALHRRESCGGHFRTEFQTDDGEAKRDDDNFAYVAVAGNTSQSARPAILNKEPLVYGGKFT